MRSHRGVCGAGWEGFGGNRQELPLLTHFRADRLHLSSGWSARVPPALPPGFLVPPNPRQLSDPLQGRLRPHKAEEGLAAWKMKKGERAEEPRVYVGDTRKEALPLSEILPVS